MERALADSNELVAGKYRVERELSEDARSRARLVRRPGQTRALVLRQYRFPDDPETRERFKECSRLVGGLKHPNIVRYADFGWLDGLPYIATFHVEGETLEQRISDRMQLSFREFVPIAAQILKAYGYAHARDFPVRSIGAHAVMLSTRKGRANFVTIVDFGEADLIAPPNAFAIAPELLPPELSDGAKASVASDVYSIGCLFHRMLTGAHVFEGTAAELEAAHRLEDPAPVTAVTNVDPEVPSELAQLISECLAKDPSARPVDANAIVERLIDFIPMKMFKLPEAGAESEPPAPTGVFEISALKTEPLVTQEMPVDPAMESRPMSVIPAEPVAPRRSRSGLLIGLAAAALLLGGLAAWQLGSKGDTSAAEPIVAGDGGERGAQLVSVRIDSDPSEARVTIDGAQRGSTPLDVDLAPGTYEIEYALAGYETLSETLEVDDGMEPVRATLRAETTEPTEVVVPRGDDAAGPAAASKSAKSGKAKGKGTATPQSPPSSGEPEQAAGDDPFLPVSKGKAKPKKKPKKPKPSADDPFLPSSG